MSILHTVNFFGSLSDQEKGMLSLYCQERFVRTGEVLFHEGDDAMAFYIVKSGKLKVYKDRSEGEILVGYAGADEAVGEMALFDASASKKRMASVKAIDDTILLVIMDYAILELSKRHPEIYEKIAQIIMKRKTPSV